MHSYVLCLTSFIPLDQPNKTMRGFLIQKYYCDIRKLGEMHGIVGRAWCYDRWYVYTYH